MVCGEGWDKWHEETASRLFDAKRHYGAGHDEYRELFFDAHDEREKQA